MSGEARLNFLPITAALCYAKPVIRRLTIVLLLCLLHGWPTGHVLAETFPLISGEMLSGEPVSFNQDGIVVKKADGTFATRVGWTNLTQTALKQLASLPKARPFVEPFLEEEEGTTARKPVEIIPKVVPRLDRPDRKAGLGVLFRSPLSTSLLVILYLAGIYAAYEISIFRGYPPALVCGVAVVAPVIGPAVFLGLPTRQPVSAEEPVEEAPPETALHDDQSAAFELGSETQAPTASPPSPKAAAGPTPPTVYQRGHTTFNRRFFETKLAGFLRVVPSDAEKDMVIQMKSARGEYVGNRISRILPNELYLQIIKAGASSEVGIPFAEIIEVTVRHKDA